ncbi:hypothetical protein ESA94_20465 [Lacibacter luteus]|uniref:Oxidase n=1 Tax=Lacibacter luteus TaxID=2508719 RepID=A0A4Q1CDF0_9BACT|nr:hypothetical protein [Lacibacter luteus]RXK57575.1 hypothetical protein ESA94_20465 [Lacibacter luteus]
MKDFLLDEDGDLRIEQGDLVIGFSNQQHQSDLLLIDKGGSKEFPELGVGLFMHLENEDRSGLLREIKVQFNADGMNVKYVAFNEQGKLVFDAPYK